MKRKRFSEEQIIAILKEGEALGNVRETCRQHNISEQTYYRWRNKFGGMEVSDVKRLKGLERENSELKKLVAELTLDNRMLKDVFCFRWKWKNPQFKLTSKQFSSLLSASFTCRRLPRLFSRAVSSFLSLSSNSCFSLPSSFTTGAT